MQSQNRKIARNNTKGTSWQGNNRKMTKARKKQIMRTPNGDIIRGRKDVFRAMSKQNEYYEKELSRYLKMTVEELAEINENELSSTGRKAYFKASERVLENAKSNKGRKDEQEQ